MAISSTQSTASTITSYDLAAAVTLSDSATIPLTRGLWIAHNNAGTIKVRMSNGDDVTFNWYGTASNLLIPVRVDKVYVTGTTASLLVIALY